MKKAWKWILGIILVLVVVAALVAGPFFIRNYMAANFTRPSVQNPAPSAPVNPANPANPANPGFNNGPRMREFDQQGRVANGFNGFKGPMMQNGRNFQRGFMPFGGFAPFGFGFMFLGGLFHLAIPLLLFGLLLFGVYQLGRNAGIRSVQVVSPTPVAPVEPPAADETPSETPAG
jgi:hypothetical protein